MFKSYPLLKRFILLVFVPVVCLLLYGWDHFNVNNIKQDTTLNVSGVISSTTIRRDSHGAVSIEAKSDQDVFFATGFVHAQDRLWQLEMQRRTAQGRLSEIFGAGSVSSDIWIRTLGLYQAAELTWNELSNEAKESLHSYAKGVNAFIASESKLPIEFVSFDIKPQPWTALDSLAQAKLFALTLSGNMWSEVNYMALSRVLNKSQLETLFASSDTHDSLQLSGIYNNQNYHEIYAIKDKIQKDLHVGGKFVGSNAWVVSGILSDNGTPMLANDPHLGIQLPSLWYVIKQKGEAIDVSGMSLIGLPLVIFGKNQSISWGGTNMAADIQDLYVEQVNPDNGQQYLYNGQWLDFDIRDEIINIAADFPSDIKPDIKPLTVRVRSTNHGPIISDAVSGLDNVLALQWTALQENDLTYESFFKLNYAQNWKQFKQATDYFGAPALNILYADDKNIGYTAAGNIPIRGVGNGHHPLAGWQSENSWQGYIPKSQMPVKYNPESGYLISANNKPIDDTYNYFISNEWASPARALRIEQLLKEKLNSKATLSMADMQAMQVDTVDLSAISLLGLLNDLKGRNPTEQEALIYLSNWDGDMSKDSPAASLFYVWAETMKMLLFDDELAGPRGMDNNTANLILEIENDLIYKILNGDKAQWCDIVQTLNIESCADVMYQGLALAIIKLKKLKGDDIEGWVWGQLNTTMYAHEAFSSVKALGLIFNRQISNGGSTNTISVSSGSYAKGVGYEQRFGAGFRHIIQIGQEQSDYLYMNSTGQSANIFSPHYDDMVEPFNQGVLYSITGDGSTLVLNPKKTDDMEGEK